MIDIKTLKKVYYNTLEMLIARNYHMDDFITKNKLKVISDEKLLEKYEKNNCRLNIKKQNNNIVSVFFFTSKIGINEIKNLFQIIKDEEINHYILITKKKITSYAQKEMKILSKGIEKELFYFDDLMINITKHNLVPKHILLTNEESRLFIKNIGKKIPYIKVNDPICKFYNGKIDQIFKIYRKNEIYYRIVVHNNII
jgi:DNA-directed RNA polymerase I, II, and III subunit RPABC1